MIEPPPVPDQRCVDLARQFTKEQLAIESVTESRVMELAQLIQNTIDKFFWPSSW